MKTTISLLALVILLAGCSQDDGNVSTESTQSEPAAAETPASAPVVAPALGEFELEHIVGDVYRGRSGRHFTVLMITPEGTVLADPINLAFAQWLEAELADKHNSEVRYVLYSHHHWDHASGGAVFADTAELIGHENMIPGLAMPLPANYIGLDVNGDGSIQQDEARGGLANLFTVVDANGDGNVTGAEINVNIVPPVTTFSDSHVVYLGGKEAQMHYVGDTHSDDGAIIYFPEEQVAFGADWLNIKGFPRILNGVSPTIWAESIDRLIALNPSRIVPGHGEIGYLDDMKAYAQYFRTLATVSESAAESSVGVEEFVESLQMDSYSDWTGFDSNMLDNAREAYEMAALSNGQ